MDQLELFIVKARTARPEYIPLSPLDIYLGHFVTGGVHFFTKLPDIDRMKRALASALDRYPSFGASMVREASTIGLDCGEVGAEFSVYRSDANCPDFRSTHSLITEALLPENAHSSYAFNSGVPVARFRLILFRDRGCALLIQHVHSQADAATVMHFLENWSLIYRGLAQTAARSYTRANIFDLTAPPGLLPSSKLNIIQRPARMPASEGEKIRDGGSIRVDIAQSALESYFCSCRLKSSISLSSSEVLHALVWKCFALTQTGADEQHNKLYTLFDLRGIKPLGIPSTYEGSAVLGRWAEASYAALRNMEVTELALSFQRQVKPFTAADASQDVSFLAHEYASGNIDENGNYTNFIIGAWVHCRDERGLIVNDLRRLATADILFEDRPARIETLVSHEINMVSIYQNDDGTITIHYAGEVFTLENFSTNIRKLINISYQNNH